MRLLVAEDDTLVRSHVVAELNSLGYKTLAAASAAQALAIVGQGAHVDLLFTDVIMPGGMNGRELAEEVLRQRPTVRVLYTSGYTESALGLHGRVDAGLVLLPKPYRKAELARLVRVALAAPIASAAVAATPVAVSDKVA